MRVIPLLFFVFFCAEVFGQNVLIKKIELAGEKIIVHYDLEDSNPQNEYKLDLYSSQDNFAAPLAKVTGDIGGEVKPGANKKVSWSVREEVGAYKGKISLEIRGKVYVPFAKLQTSVIKGYKRGKSYSISWKSGNTNPVHLELYKGGQRVSGDMNIPNNGGHTLFIPASAKKGSDYRLKMTDAKNNEEILYSPSFKVKPKVPLAFKVIPILGLGALVASLAGGGGGDEGSSDTVEIELPPFPGN